MTARQSSEPRAAAASRFRHAGEIPRTVEMAVDGGGQALQLTGQLGRRWRRDDVAQCLAQHDALGVSKFTGGHMLGPGVGEMFGERTKTGVISQWPG